MSLRLDDCCHCPCVTYLSGFTVETAIAALKSGQLGCDNCRDDDAIDGSGHTTCVALYNDEDKIVWDGRHE